MWIYRYSMIVMFVILLKVKGWPVFPFFRATGRLPSERESSSQIAFFKGDRWYRMSVYVVL